MIGPLNQDHRDYVGPLTAASTKITIDNPTFRHSDLCTFKSKNNLCRHVFKIVFRLPSLEEEEMALPEAKEVRVEQKRFYFDVGSNARGVFLRLSEVSMVLVLFNCHFVY